jgi:RNA polymerase sigma factor (sigma-70 family)
LEAHSAHEAPASPVPSGGRFMLARRSDERLVALVRQGDAAAFETLYDRYHLRILSFCRHMLGSQPDGEDATQHAFVALHRHLTADEREVDVKPWLFQVARNRCLSLLRARREHADVDDPGFQPATEGLADSVQRRSDLRELLADLHRLPEEQRAALVLSSLGDLSGDEIAEVIGCRPQKVKALVFQARSALMSEREARNTDCDAIREQLATLSGGSLLRGSLRRHVRGCEGCRAFRDQTRHQRQAMAILLPVIPAAGLKSATMSAAFGGATHAAGGAAAAAGGGGAIAGLSAAGKAGAAKLLLVTALAGSTVGAGVAEVQHLRKDSGTPATTTEHDRSAPAVRQTTSAPASSTAPGVSSISSSATKGRHGKSHAGHGAKAGARPTSSPAASPNAATGKGIAGTQPGHGNGTHGKAGAPGQLKKHSSPKVRHHAPPKPVHTAPVHTPKPKPVTPAPSVPPSGPAKEKPANVAPVAPPAAEQVVTQVTSTDG